ncbi:uncharacterized protein LOC113291167 [Papaver somniferum]|uniref:uncharacterized protein LOC113291167 n=1 Tax=Papaver somniferum TaxID=3469 RepID=UPI000E6F51F5|nr:uncharacterized protein LOC113291167 [Papaver somniferum]
MPFGLSNAPNTFMQVMNQVLTALRKHKLYAATKKCSFCTDKVLFLGYVITKEGIKVDESKIDALRTWPSPSTLTKAKAFHGFASFYRHFIKNFSTIVALITDCLKTGNFIWTEEVERSFHDIKHKLMTTTILSLPDFTKTFEVHTDASKVGVGAVLSQQGRSVAYFSEKLGGSKLRYSTYELEFYVIVQTFNHWRHYLIHGAFFLYTDYDALKYTGQQDSIRPRHSQWSNYLQELPS